MHIYTDRATASIKPGNRSLEVKLGRMSPALTDEILTTISPFAIGGGPMRSATGDLAFRFPALEWDEIIRPFLLRKAMPFKIVKTQERDSINHSIKKKVYLVEDDLDTLFALNAMLEKAGYDVLLSHSARRLMEEHLPETDLFILDRCLADGDGLQIYKKLREHPETRLTPVIMMSASEEAHAEATAAGLSEFIQKPFSSRAFLTLVSRNTNRRNVNSFPDAAQ